MYLINEVFEVHTFVFRTLGPPFLSGYIKITWACGRTNSPYSFCYFGAVWGSRFVVSREAFNQWLCVVGDALSANISQGHVMLKSVAIL